MNFNSFSHLVSKVFWYYVEFYSVIWTSIFEINVREFSFLFFFSLLISGYSNLRHFTMERRWDLTLRSKLIHSFIEIWWLLLLVSWSSNCWKIYYKPCLHFLLLKYNLDCLFTSYLLFPLILGLCSSLAYIHFNKMKYWFFLLLFNLLVIWIWIWCANCDCKRQIQYILVLQTKILVRDRIYRFLPAL